MNITKLFNYIVVCVLLSACQTSQGPDTTHLTDKNDCPLNVENPSVHCGAAPTTTFDEKGRLWVAFEYHQQVYVSYSDDQGGTYSKAVVVNSEPESIYNDGENRPKIALGKNNEIYISWSKRTEGKYNGDIRFSRSLDQGKTFEAVKTINDDGLLTGHRFDSLHVDAEGHIFILWIDKRDRVTAKKQGEDYTGAALYYAVSTDAGKTFVKNQRIAHNSCECCRIGIVEAHEGGAAIFWRHIFEDSIRDHGFAVLGSQGVSQPVIRASRDNWKIEACPHHGPAITQASNEKYHTVWFTSSEQRKGIYYGRYNPASQKMEQVNAISNSPSSSRPFIYNANNDGLFVIWKRYNGEKTEVNMTVSTDGGKSWSSKQIIASTDDASDHPFVISNNKHVYLAWHSKNEGLRHMKID